MFVCQSTFVEFRLSDISGIQGLATCSVLCYEIRPRDACAEPDFDHSLLPGN